MRHTGDHKDERCSHISAPLEPAAPVTSLSGPFPAMGQLIEVGDTQSRFSPMWLWKQSRGLPLCLFFTVNPELPPLRNACSPRFLYLQKHLQSTRSLVESLFPLPSRLCEGLFSILRFHGNVPAPVGCTQDTGVPSGTFLSAQPDYTEELSGNMQLDVVYVCVILAAPEVELSVDGRTALSLGVLV